MLLFRAKPLEAVIPAFLDRINEAWLVPVLQGKGVIFAADNHYLDCVLGGRSLLQGGVLAQRGMTAILRT